MSLQPSSLGAALLGRTREAVIGLLFTGPTVGLHVREIARRTGFSAPTVARELRMLEAIGVVTSEAIGRQVSYRANPACAIYPELQSIAVKTWGLRGRVGTAISSLEGIEAAFIYGSFAAGQAHPTSDVDVTVSFATSNGTATAGSRRQNTCRSTNATTPNTTQPTAIHCAVASPPIVQASGRNISTKKRPSG